MNVSKKRIATWDKAPSSYSFFTLYPRFEERGNLFLSAKTLCPLHLCGEKQSECYFLHTPNQLYRFALPDKFTAQFTG